MGVKLRSPTGWAIITQIFGQKYRKYGCVNFRSILTDIIRAEKQRRTVLLRHVARMREMRFSLKILVGEIWKRAVRRILKQILKKLSENVDRVYLVQNKFI
jgi:hypothetical protein